MAMNTNNPFTSLYDVIVFSSLDWASAKDLAWIWGIVVGWEDDEGSALPDLADIYGWSDEAVERLRRLHKEYETMRIIHEGG
jgi:hypothetical protein